MRKRLTKAGDSHAATLSKETLELPGMLVVFAQPNVTGCWHPASGSGSPKNAIYSFEVVANQEQVQTNEVHMVGLRER